MSVLNDPEIEGAFRTFSKRARTYQRYKTWGRGTFFVLYLSGVVVFGSAALPEGDWFEPPGVYLGILGFSLVLAGGIISMISRRKGRLYRMASEYFLFLRVFSAIESLEAFFKTSSQADRNRAEEKTREIVERVEKWNVTGLQLVKNEVGKHVIPLKGNLREKLLPALEEGDDENLRKGYDFLGSFAKYLIRTEPTVEDMQNLNELLETITTVSTEKTPGFKDRVKVGKMGHVVAFTACSVAGFLAFCVGYYLLSVPMEAAYAVGFGFAGVLAAGYLNYIRKQD